MSGSTTYRLNCSRSQTVDASRFSSFLSQESLTFKEVDFSECNLTNDTLKVVLDICKRCPKLRILKLYKNQLDDGATQRLAEMLLRTPELEELHLSHNLFTADGVKCLVAAGGTFADDDKSQPLWLRLEQNSVENPEMVINELEAEFSVCRRSDSVRCTVRTCMNKKKVHLPFFHLQRQPLRFKSRAEAAAEAKAKQAPPVPTRSISRPEAGAPKAAKPCAWGQGRGASGSPVSQMSQSGYPAPGAKTPEAAKTLPEKPEAPMKPLWKAGSRPSVVLDSFGQRRTMPDQLNGVDPTPFVCTLCHFVMIKPLITQCSHIFCSCCFRQWVQQEVELHKSQNKTNGAPPVAVPQIRCPQPGCDQFLKKTDVEPADDGKTSGVQLFQRLRNNLIIRCVHHLDHHKFEFGKDASRLFEKGISCSWSGAPSAYEEHMSHNCAVENYLMSESSVDTINSNEGTRSQYEAEPEPEDSVAAEPKADSTMMNPTEGEVRIALYDYVPAEGEEAQIKISQNDYIRVFQVTETGWAAGVRLCRKTMQEEGDAGWFPAGYLQPLQGAQ